MVFSCSYIYKNIYVHCKQKKMDIVRQKLDERIYFWHVEIVFKKVPFYVCDVHGCKYEREEERLTFIRRWRSPWGIS